MAKDEAKALNMEDWLNLLDWAAGAVKRGSLTSEQYVELAMILKVWATEQTQARLPLNRSSKMAKITVKLQCKGPEDKDWQTLNTREGALQDEQMFMRELETQLVGWQDNIVYHDYAFRIIKA